MGQHHGLPTRLMDWSQSPLVALHFATSENNLDKMDAHDCMIWRIDMKELHNLLPARYKEELDKHRSSVFTVNMLTDVVPSLKQYDEDMKDNAMVVIEPPSIDPRIVNQYSFFSIVPNGIEEHDQICHLKRSALAYKRHARSAERKRENVLPRPRRIVILVGTSLLCKIKNAMAFAMAFLFVKLIT